MKFGVACAFKPLLAAERYKGAPVTAHQRGACFAAADALQPYEASDADMEFLSAT